MGPEVRILLEEIGPIKIMSLNYFFLSGKELYISVFLIYLCVEMGVPSIIGVLWGLIIFAQLAQLDSA